ncbi:MAG: aminopeptidase P family protein [Chloroflexi bacterium]|nr:aminopeptidase P family protein [Chloroflexota bacterium]
MNQQNLERFRDYLQANGLAAALLSSPFTLTWLTGYAPPIQTGPSPFEGGPALGWWCDGGLTLILSDAEAGAASATGANVRDYVGYTIEEPLPRFEPQKSALHEILGEHARLAGVVGVELDYLPAAFAPVIHEALSQATLQPLDGRLDALRAVKTAEEIEKIRAALHLCDLAQADIRDHAQAGLSELDLWGGMKARLEVTAGTRLPILADLVAGGRTAEIGGLPTGYVLQPGDPLIFDVVPRLDGYWGDNAAAYFVGEPPPELAKIYSIVRDTLNRGVDAIRPGLRARELDTMLREAIRSAGYAPYPHHTGHGLGVAFHEEPRIVPYNEMALAAGMVLAVEPGIYLPGVGGVRLEHALLVTPDGCEVLTQHL